MSKMYAIAQVKAPLSPSEDHPYGEFEVVLSAPTLDRDDEVIDAGAFEPLPEHITFDVDHGMSTGTTVGSGVPYYADDGTLCVKGTFSSIPRAQEVRTLVTEGHIRTTSVAFMAARREEGEDGKVHVVSAELLNGAFVPIPSNREAVVLTAKAFAERTFDEKMQAIHDLAVQNGAKCATESDSTRAPAVPVETAGNPDRGPAESAGTPPASEVVKAARLMADAALLVQ